MSSEHHTTTAWTDEQETVETPLFADPETALHTTREVVGRKWHPVILFYLLEEGPLGFSALKGRTDGISSKMLSESLSDLEDAGLVTRHSLDEKPVRVEYTVSTHGETLGPVIEAMVDWGIQEDT
jgi:DNA-binding HxlR family transcriptional regulator